MATQQISARQIPNDAIVDAMINTAAAIASTKLAAWSADRDANNNKLINLADATADHHAVNLGQLNAAITASAAGLAVKEPVRAASTANISTTYNSTNGPAANGQHTGAPDTIDGVSLAVGNRILLKNQTSGAENGIYVVTTVGSGSNGVWDRAEDFNANDEVVGSVFTLVQEGTTNEDTQWVLTNDGAITVGTGSGTALVFTQFGAGQTYTADGTTITLSGSEFSITSGGVGTTQLANDAVTSDKIAEDAVTSDHLAVDAVYTNAIQDDAVTQAKIAAGAVGNTELGADAVDGSKIANDSIDSEHYVAGSIDEEHLANSSVTAAKLAGSIPGGKLALISQDVTGTQNGSNTNFTMSHEPVAGTLLVFLNGVRQRPTTDFTFSSTTLTFTTAPEAGENISVFGLQV